MEKYRTAIKQIAYGLLLIVFHFNLGTIDILPNWLGFYFIYKAIQVIGEQENSALLMKKIAFVLFGYHLVDWFLTIVGISMDHYVLSILLSICTLYLYYHLYTSIGLVCDKRKSKYTKRVFRLRNVLTIMFTLSSISMLFFGETMSVLYFVIAIIYILSIVMMVVTLFNIANEEKSRL